MNRYSYTTKATATPATNTLLQTKGTMIGGGVMDWDTNLPDGGLHVNEIKMLQSKHGTKNVIMKRATAVKGMMMQGKTQAQITRALKPLGWGYGERMIKADHAALSKAISAR